MWSSDMKMIGNQRGFTLVELMMSIGMVVMISGLTAAMMIATMNSYERESAQVNTDTDASIAMRYIVRDVREANYPELIDVNNAVIPKPTADNPDRPVGVKLNVILPSLVASAGGNYYDKSLPPDTAHKIYYYLSDKTGAQNLTGAGRIYLWRKDTRQPTNKQCILIAKNVKSLSMIYDQAKSIKVSIITQQFISGGTRQNPAYTHTDLTQREVYLRND
jgi:type II secretory pathway pseudopilin PulG